VCSLVLNSDPSSALPNSLPSVSTPVTPSLLSSDLFICSSQLSSKSTPNNVVARVHISLSASLVLYPCIAR
jgi:hypothetical protein